MGDTTGDGFARFAQAVQEFFSELMAILMAVPRAPAAFASVWRKVFAEVVSGPGPALTLLLLALCVVIVLAPGRILRKRPVPTAFAKGTRFERLAHVLVNDAIDLGAAALAAILAAALIFNRAGGDDGGAVIALDRICVSVLWAVVRWRACMYGLELFLRPAHSHGREAWEIGRAHV